MRHFGDARLWLGLVLLACSAPVGHADISFAIGEEGASSVFAISHDRKLLLSSGASHSLQIWDVATSKVLRTIPHPEPFGAAVFSADDKLVATWSDNDPPFSYPGNVGLWEVESGKARELPKCDRGHWFSDDLDVYATIDTTANQVLLFETASGKQLAKWTRINDEKGPIIRVFIAPKTHTVLTVAHHGKWSQLVARDPVAGTSTVLDNQNGIVYSAGFGPQEKTAFAGLQWGRDIHLQDGGTLSGPSGEGFSFGVRQWDLTTGKKISDWKGEKGFGNARIHFAPQCETCAVECTAGSFEPGSLTLREPATGRVLSRIFDGPSNISGNPGIKDLQNSPKGSAVLLGYAPVGNLLAVGYGGPSVDFVDSSTGKAIKTVEAKSWYVGWSAFSPDGKMFGISELTVSLLPGQSFRALIQLSETTPAPGEEPMHRELPPPKPADDAGAGPGGTRPAAANRDAGEAFANFLGKLLYSGSNSQCVGVQNWAPHEVSHLHIEAGGGSYDWPFPIRPGGMGSNITPVRDVVVTGKVHVTYVDGDGKRRSADFENVPTERGTDYPHREFFFDAAYNLVLHAFDLAEQDVRDEKWLLPAGGPKPDKAIAIPQFIGIGGSASRALVRYPRNDSIAEYRQGQMIGGDKDDPASHDGPDGVARYRIESITATELVLVRDGGKIRVPLITDAAGK